MRNIFILSLVLSLTASFPVLAQHDHGAEHNHNDAEIQEPHKDAAKPVATKYAGETIHAKVDGLVCDFCARAVEKVFGKQDEVSSVKVDLGEKLITIILKAGKQMDDAKITKLITDSGFKLVGIHHQKAGE